MPPVAVTPTPVVAAAPVAAAPPVAASTRADDHGFRVLAVDDSPLMRTFLQNTGPYRRKMREAEYGSLEHDGEFLDSISPIHKADRIQCPMLVAHGANDPRVPLSEAQQIVAALEKRGAPVELLVFPDEGHGVAKRANRIVLYERVAGFLAKHL